MDNSITSNLNEVRATLPQGVALVAVSKFHPASSIETAYAAGQRLFGESHEQELAKKYEALPKDIKWHFIGHLQTNKVRYIAPYISMIEAVDSPKLLHEINKQALRNNRVIDVLLELHIAEEETKYGFPIDDCRQYLVGGEWREMSNVRIRGLMMMASNTDDARQIRREFSSALRFFEELKSTVFANVPTFDTRSWGMSHDYLLAVECGSNMVRVGTKIFGDRQYSLN